MATVGDKIKEYRLKLGISQKELSDDTNISISSINKYEMGLRNPKFETLQKISTALKVTLNDLLGSDEKELAANFKEVSKSTIVDQEIEILKHIEEILKISESIGYENCFKFFNLLNLDEKLYLSVALRKFISQEIKNSLYLNGKYKTLSSNMQSHFGVLDTETIKAIDKELENTQLNNSL